MSEKTEKMTPQTVELTPEQTAIAVQIGNNVVAIESFGVDIEIDLKDGLSRSELLENLFGATQMVSAVSSTIAQGRKWNKQPKAAQAKMLEVVAGVIGGDPENAGSRVALTFDFVAKMSEQVAKIVAQTKGYVKAIKAVGKAPEAAA